MFTARFDGGRRDGVVWSLECPSSSRRALGEPCKGEEAERQKGNESEQL
jgi:hypothetical protein